MLLPELWGLNSTPRLRYAQVPYLWLTLCLLLPIDVYLGTSSPQCVVVILALYGTLCTVVFASYACHLPFDHHQRHRLLMTGGLDPPISESITQAVT